MIHRFFTLLLPVIFCVLAACAPPTESSVHQDPKPGADPQPCAGPGAPFRRYHGPSPGCRNPPKRRGSLCLFPGGYAGGLSPRNGDLYWHHWPGRPL